MVCEFLDELKEEEISTPIDKYIFVSKLERTKNIVIYIREGEDKTYDFHPEKRMGKQREDETLESLPEYANQ